MLKVDNREVAYFSMEIGLSSKIPTYSGGLGVLAGDTLKAAADVGLPMVGITLLNKHGYFFQGIHHGVQTEMPVSWNIDDFLEPTNAVVEVNINDENVKIGSWVKTITGIDGYQVPIIFLNTDLPENSEHAKDITDHLYGSGHEYRLQQEVVLGIGGFRMLEELGYKNLKKYHMNEGHSALLSIELFNKTKDREAVKQFCVFTTHTPVAAGHDKFDIGTAKKVLDEDTFNALPIEFIKQGEINMTMLALNHSGYVNGVAQKHAEVSKEMFPHYDIKSITNGVHAETWVSPHFSKLYDEFIPDWRHSPEALRCISSVDTNKIWEAHFEGKKQIIDFTNATTNAGLDYDNFTIGWARRFTSYKRPDLFLENISRIIKIAERHGPIQIIYAGKAHPEDMEGKKLLRKVIEISEELNDIVKMAYLPNYDMYVSKFLVGGVDVWLNTPMPPLEASGTSGMKCALNGIPQISVLDGWWNEGCVEDETGWYFTTSDELYDLLDNKVVDCFYNKRDKWTQIMQKSIMLNGAYFNARRMINEYMKFAYRISQDNKAKTIAELGQK